MAVASRLPHVIWQMPVEKEDMLQQTYWSTTMTGFGVIGQACQKGIWEVGESIDPARRGKRQSPGKT